MSFSDCKKIFNPSTPPSLYLKLPGNSTVIPKITCNVDKKIFFFSNNLLKTTINKTGKAFYSLIIIWRRLLLLLLFTMLNLQLLLDLLLLLLPLVCFSRPVEHPSISPTFKTYFIVKFLLFIVMPSVFFLKITNPSGTWFNSL